MLPTRVVGAGGDAGRFRKFMDTERGEVHSDARGLRENAVVKETRALDPKYFSLKIHLEFCSS